MNSCPWCGSRCTAHRGAGHTSNQLIRLGPILTTAGYQPKKVAATPRRKVLPSLAPHREDQKATEFLWLRIRGARGVFVGGGKTSRTPSANTTGLYSSGTLGCMTGLFRYLST